MYKILLEKYINRIKSNIFELEKQDKTNHILFIK
jgi:hypothetical protein